MTDNMPQGDPLVSIRCLVYNHEPYLRQCLDGFVMQKTTFPFEAIVHDDASTDGSAAIIREYAEKYPHIIKPIYETENQYGKGIISKNMDAVMHPNSKYIATCEGDDFWTDPHKLQIQVDFLETHPDYVMSCHEFSVFHQDTKTAESGHERFRGLSYDVSKGNKYHTFTNDDYYNIWFIQTVTVVRRKIKFIDDKKKQKYPRFYDYIFFYYVTKQGNCAFFLNDMATYRVHKDGAFSGRKIEVWNENYLKSCYVLYQLENEKRVIPSLNAHFVDLFIHLLTNKQYKRALDVLARHQKNISTKNTFVCFGKIINRVFEILLNKTTGKDRA